MSLVLKLFWIFCLGITFISVSITISRFYEMGRMFMFCAGSVALLFIASMLCSAVYVLFLKGV
jgi:hypothetical protein